MLSYKLGEIFDDVPEDIAQEEVRIAYQAQFRDKERIRHHLAKQLDIPLEFFEQFPIELNGVSAHVITLNDTRHHILVVSDELLLRPEAHRKIISHEF